MIDSRTAEIADILIAHEAANVANETIAKIDGGKALSAGDELATAALDGFEMLAKEKLDIEEKSGIDDLTGLANSTGLNKGLSRIVTELSHMPAEQRQDLLVLRMDVRLFKVFNELFGWNTGNDVLKKYGINFNEGHDGTKFRKYDLLARIGGDDFVMAFKISDMESAKVIMRKLMSVGVDLSQELEDVYGQEFRNQVARNPVPIIKATRVPMDTDPSELEWDKLGVGGLTIAGRAFSFNDEDAKNIANLPPEKIWETVFSDRLDEVYASAKAIESKVTTAVLWDAKGVGVDLNDEVNPTVG